MWDGKSYKTSWFAKPWAKPLNFLLGFLSICSFYLLFYSIPEFALTVGHLFSTDLSFREYMEVKPDGFIVTRWTGVMLPFFFSFILWLGYRTWIAHDRFKDRKRWEERVKKDRIWIELESLTKKELLDLAEERRLSPRLSMKSKKETIQFIIFSQIKTERENR